MTRSYSFARSSPDAKLLEIFVGEVVRLLARVHEEAQERRAAACGSAAASPS